jgi:hypothetical protein
VPSSSGGAIAEQTSYEIFRQQLSQLEAVVIEPKFEISQRLDAVAEISRAVANYKTVNDPTNDTHQLVKSEVSFLLGRLGGNSSDELRVALGAADALHQLGADAVPAFLAALDTKSIESGRLVLNFPEEIVVQDVVVIHRLMNAVREFAAGAGAIPANGEQLEPFTSIVTLSGALVVAQRIATDENVPDYVFPMSIRSDAFSSLQAMTLAQRKGIPLEKVAEGSMSAFEKSVFDELIKIAGQQVKGNFTTQATIALVAEVPFLDADEFKLQLLNALKSLATTAHDSFARRIATEGMINFVRDGKLAFQIDAMQRRELIQMPLDLLNEPSPNRVVAAALTVWIAQADLTEGELEGLRVALTKKLGTAEIDTYRFLALALESVARAVPAAHAQTAVVMAKVKVDQADTDSKNAETAVIEAGKINDMKQAAANAAGASAEAKQEAAKAVKDLDAAKVVADTAQKRLALANAEQTRAEESAKAEAAKFSAFKTQNKPRLQAANVSPPATSATIAAASSPGSSAPAASNSTPAAIFPLATIPNRTFGPTDIPFFANTEISRVSEHAVLATSRFSARQIVPNRPFVSIGPNKDDAGGKRMLYKDGQTPVRPENQIAGLRTRLPSTDANFPQNQRAGLRKQSTSKTNTFRSFSDFRQFGNSGRTGARAATGATALLDDADPIQVKPKPGQGM